MCDKTVRIYALILLGDFNAKVRKEHSNKRVVGRHTLHDITSEHGEKLLQLAIAHNLEISSTKFQHRRIHKGTESPQAGHLQSNRSCTHKQKDSIYNY